MGFTYRPIEESCTDTISSNGKPISTVEIKYRLRYDGQDRILPPAAKAGFIQESGIYAGFPYPDMPSAICRSIVISKLRSRPPRQAWEVDCQWSTDTELIDDPDPSHRRYIRRGGTSEQQRFVFFDRNGNLIVDSAGSPPDGGVPVNVRLWTGVWEHNVDASQYDLSRSATLSGCINSDVFLGKQPYTLMLDVQFSEEREGIYHFYKEILTVMYDPLGWRPQFADAGLWEIDKPGTSQATRIRIKNAVEPEPLYPNGVKVPFNRRPQDCQFKPVDYYNQIPFSSLNLPTGNIA